MKTGSKWGAGTDANVFLKITGEKGDTGERQMEHSLTNTNKFEDNKASYNIIFDEHSGIFDYLLT